MNVAHVYMSSFITGVASYDYSGQESHGLLSAAGRNKKAGGLIDSDFWKLKTQDCEGRGRWKS